MTGLEIRRKPDQALPPLPLDQMPPPQPPSAPQTNPAPGSQGPLVAEVIPGALLGAVSGPGLVLVDCYAVWCNPCRMMAPMFEELAREYAGRARFLKLNTDLDRDVLGMYGITAIPTTILFKDGVVAARIVGAQHKTHFEELIRRFL